jgi:hypothetical protein
MRKLISLYDGVMLGYYRGILEDHGIDCMARNEFLAGAAGELPPAECWPELWVTDDADYDRARTLVAAAPPPAPQSARVWACPACGEVMEPQFTACWHCGAERPFGTVR